MLRPSLKEIAYVQTVPDGKSPCRDRPRLKVPMTRPSRVQYFLCVIRAFEVEYDQTIPDQKRISPGFRAFLSRLSYAPNQFRAFQHQSFGASIFRPPCVHEQAFVRSPDREKIHLVVQCYSLKMKTAEGF